MLSVIVHSYKLSINYLIAVGKKFEDILNQSQLGKQDLIRLISSDGEERKLLLKKAGEQQTKYRNNKVYFRGLVEFSNYCTKDCLYCGIRKSNSVVERYDIDDEEILKAARFAHENKYGSLVMQSGERDDAKFINRITQLLNKIKEITKGELGITISLGEQTPEP